MGKYSVLQILASVVILDLLYTTNALEYVCYPNGTFVVTNPDPSFTSANVKDEFSHCRSQMSDDNRFLRIDGCKMDHYVEVIFYKKSSLPTILARDNKSGPFKIFCKNLPPEGIEISIRTGIGIRTRIEEIGDNKNKNTDVIRIISHVEEEGQSLFTTLRLDDKLEWVFEIPEDFLAIPISCTAYSGREASPSAENVLLVKNGCPVYPDVFPVFQQIQSTDATVNNNYYALTFQAFRFRYEAFVTVSCRMRTCVDLPGHSCKANCDQRRRRRALRRAPRDTSQDITMSAVLEVDDHHARHQDVNMDQVMDNIIEHLKEDELYRPEV